MDVLVYILTLALAAILGGFITYKFNGVCVYVCVCMCLCVCVYVYGYRYPILLIVYVLP